MGALPWIAAIAAIVAAGAAVYLAVAAVNQLTLIRDQLEQQRKIFSLAGDRERKWETLRACDQCVNEPVVSEAGRQLWELSSNGKDYSQLTEADLLHAIIILNALDKVAIGIEQGVFIDDLAYDHLEIFVEKSVKIFLKNEPYEGCPPCSHTIPRAEHAYRRLIDMHNRWFPPTGKPRFQE